MAPHLAAAAAAPVSLAAVRRRARGRPCPRPRIPSLRGRADKRGDREDETAWRHLYPLYQRARLSEYEIIKVVLLSLALDIGLELAYPTLSARAADEPEALILILAYSRARSLMPQRQ